MVYNTLPAHCDFGYKYWARAEFWGKSEKKDSQYWKFIMTRELDNGERVNYGFDNFNNAVEVRPCRETSSGYCITGRVIATARNYGC